MDGRDNDNKQMKMCLKNAYKKMHEINVETNEHSYKT